jgi:Skp family chaperone for outer membrane proteins
MRLDRLTLLIAAAVAVAALVTAREANARRVAAEAHAAALAAPPVAVATVDVAKVFEKLKENADWDILIRNLATSFTEELRARQTELEKLLKELEGITDAAKRSELADDIAMKRLRLEEWARLKQGELDRERSLKWQSMYRSIREESRKVAESEGYQLVLVDDSQTAVGAKTQVKASLEEQVVQQIASLRVLYAAPTVDISDKVVVRINNLKATRNAQ